MESNRLIPWTAFTLFVLAIVITVLLVFAPTLAQLGLLISSEVAVWVIGVLALLFAILGFIAFKTPQGKIAAIGGVVLLLAVLFIIPISVATTR